MVGVFAETKVSRKCLYGLVTRGQIKIADKYYYQAIQLGQLYFMTGILNFFLAIV